MTKIVSIHQPNFFPWLGFFDKWKRSDVLILLDDAQMQKTGGGWSNRSAFLGKNGPAWITASVNRSFEGVKNLNEIFLSPDPQWRESAVQRFRSYYSASPMFSVAQSIFEPQVLKEHSKLVDLNVDALLEIGTRLGLDTSKIRRSSEFSVESVATDRLCKLVKAVDGDSYLHGLGGLNYQDNSVFLSNGIELIAQNFVQKKYDQGRANEFHPGLSAIDSIANIGAENTMKLLEV